jgi:transposase
MVKGAGLEGRGRKNKDASKVDKSAVQAVHHPGPSGAFQEIPYAERATLQQWARRRTSPHRLVVRSRIVLLAADGLSPATIAATLQVSPATVRLWKQRFALGGPAALATEAPGRGRRPGTALAVTVAVLEATRAIGTRRVTVRRVAAQAGTSPSTVWRVWRRYALGPESSSDSVERALRKAIPETPLDGR